MRKKMGLEYSSGHNTCHSEGASATEESAREACKSEQSHAREE